MIVVYMLVVLRNCLIYLTQIQLQLLDSVSLLQFLSSTMSRFVHVCQLTDCSTSFVHFLHVLCSGFLFVDNASIASLKCSDARSFFCSCR